MIPLNSARELLFLPKILMKLKEKSQKNTEKGEFIRLKIERRPPTCANIGDFEHRGEVVATLYAAYFKASVGGATRRLNALQRFDRVFEPTNELDLLCSTAANSSSNLGGTLPRPIRVGRYSYFVFERHWSGHGHPPIPGPTPGITEMPPAVNIVIPRDKVNCRSIGALA